MNDSLIGARSIYYAVYRFWQRIPLVIQAVVMGLLVFAIVGNFARTVILLFIPVPWSFLVMGGVLWAFWKYFSGSWWPQSTSEARQIRFRTSKLQGSVWKWSLIAALLGVIIMEASFVVVFRITQFPAAKWEIGYDLSSFPLWTIWLFILTASLVAGITEEVGFRGYMQVPLERRYNALTGITVVSLAFVAIHLNQPWAPPVLIPLFAISVIWGVLAYTSGSLIPAIISHAGADIINFSYWWTDVAGRFDRLPVSETGIDLHFILWVIILLASLVGFTLAARKTLAARIR
jgi:membrane protease YdiL (CAAX protease family)